MAMRTDEHMRKETELVDNSEEEGITRKGRVRDSKVLAYCTYLLKGLANTKGRGSEDHHTTHAVTRVDPYDVRGGYGVGGYSGWVLVD